MSTRPEGNVEHWRGIDPEWWECGGLSYTNHLIRAPGDALVQALLGYREMPKTQADLLTDAEGLAGLVRGEPACIFQLRGHDWTQVDTPVVVQTVDMVQDLSRRLSTQGFEYDWDDVASALSYQIFEGGEFVEGFSMFNDNPTYQGPEGETALHRKLTEGWQISRDHTFEFFSKRGTKVDVESREECEALLGRVVTGLGMYIACHPFWFNRKLGRVDRMPDWHREHFTAAKVLYHAGIAKPH